MQSHSFWPFRGGGFALLVVASALTGCTSLRGSQESVLTSALGGIQRQGSDYGTYEDVIKNYEGKSGEERREFRNRVLMIYMDAIDETYDKYSKQLFSEGIQSGLAFDTGILAMSAMAALFKESADEMATLIAMAAGVHAAIDKNLYFDRTLPALIETMDTNRIKVGAEITAKMALPTSEYPIEGALRDLRRYQEAGTLFRAVTEITGTAAQKKTEAQAQADRLKIAFGCEPNDALRTASRPIQTSNLSYQATLSDPNATQKAKDEAAAKISAIAAIISLDLNQKIDPNLAPLAMGDAVADALDNPAEKFCRAADVDELRKRVAAYLVKEN